MTLNTTNIKRYGEKLYRQLSNSSYLGADACADAYRMFVSRMNAYREKHPGTERVSDAFVTKSRRWITANLLARRKRRRIREATELELAKRTALSADAPVPRQTGNTVLFVKLEGFFSHWLKENPRAAEYARVFLLFHAWSLSPRRVRLFAPLVSGRKSEFVRAVKRIKKHVAARTSRLAADCIRNAQYWYSMSVRAELEAEESKGKKRTAALARRKRCLSAHKQALARLGQVVYRPEQPYLAEVAGVTVERVRYALRVCEREIKAYFQ